MMRFADLFTRSVFLLFCALLFSFACNAQLTLPDLNLSELQREDREKAFDIRCAAPFATEITYHEGVLRNHEAVLVDVQNQANRSNKLEWEYDIRGKNALGLTLLLKNFFLPDGAILTVYNSDSSQTQIFSAKDNNSKQILTIGMISGNTARLHYSEISNGKAKGRFQIFTIYQAYKKTHELPENRPLAFGFGTSLACNININCPGTDSVKNIKRGISRVMMVLKEGVGYCTGNLLNNTNQDGKPYILTAFHCQDGYTPMYDFWKFDFKYESTNCLNPIKEPKP
ncbi:MAG: hypothetical protein ACOYOA_16455, partial [Saprospiraceae bacterium]